MSQEKSAYSIKQDVYFLFVSAAILLFLQTIGRAALLWYNGDLAAAIPTQVIRQAFLTGFRFDLIVTSFVMIPLVLMLLRPKGIPRKMAVAWVSIMALVMTFLSITELDFYREFHVRLNSLAIEYLKEDPATVLSMIWYGYPVVRYLIVITLVAVIFYKALSTLTQWRSQQQKQSHYAVRAVTFVSVALLVVVFARGTLRQGPPLRWGDAFFSNYLFANHLALNGSYTLTKAFLNQSSRQQNEKWLKAMPEDQALAETEQMVLTPEDKMLQPASLPLWRQHDAGADNHKQPPNVVFILMESFSGEFVGSLGHDYGITPNFDRLRQQGLLFKRFFSNGTHTHQGMFASMTCFPNLPGHEYLMQQPEGDRNFGGMLSMLSDRDYSSLYVYNGDFSWDNQRGFFTRQGMQRFIGRHDFVNPVFSDPTWGVSDQDMFDRAAEELQKMPEDKPFFAFLQTLSNHTPYALPSPLPVEPVTGFGRLDEHLTAMRYADWALGQFFDKIKDSDFYDNTVFVLVGDHGFGTDTQLTDIDLLRFHVPLLIMGGGIQNLYGDSSDMVGSQVDIVPTVAGLLGGESRYGCWGRDLLAVNDKGFAVIKPSGSDQTTAIVRDNEIMVRTEADRQKLYQYQLGAKPEASLMTDKTGQVKTLSSQLLAYIQAASNSLRSSSHSILQTAATQTQGITNNRH